MSEHKDCMKKIRMARIDLLARHPFFASLAFGMEIEINEELQPPTAATDGEAMYFHPEFVSTLSVSETVFLIAHECMHPALFHITRRGKRDARLWNIACDIVVNNMLVCNNVGTMPKCGIHMPDYYHRGGGKVEYIYKLLEEESDARKGRGEKGLGECAEPGDGNNTATENMSSIDAIMETAEGGKEAVAAKWRTKVLQAVEAAKMAGKVPAGMEEYVKNIVSPQVPWPTLLRNFLLTTKGSEQTWAKLNRRYQCLDVTLPGNYGYKVGEIAVLLDCSGSMNTDVLERCLSEIEAIQQELRPEKIHVVCFDTEVGAHTEFEPDDVLDVMPTGRGGTDFKAPFAYLERHGIEPTTCVVLSDMYCSSFPPPPDYPVLWVSYGGSYTPFGQIINTNIKG